MAAPDPPAGRGPHAPGHRAGAVRTAGATPWAEQVRGELRASGQTTHRRDPSTLSQLTPQELQIARLAGQGLANQQIAERLYLSRHTIGYHLHKIYTKLGITSRAELGQLQLDNESSH